MPEKVTTVQVRITVDKMADWLEKLLNAHLEEAGELTDYQQGVRDGIRTVIEQMRANEREAFLQGAKAGQFDHA
jgi:hypothetical protein